MDVKIYTGPGGVTASLTTDSPASHYGIPALRIEGPGVEQWPDLGPADVLPSKMPAAHLVVACALGQLPGGVGGTIHPMSAEVLEAARRFLAQWPEGPQLAEPR